MVVFPCLGQEVLGPACLEPVGLKDVTSPTAFFARSASETVPVSHVKSSAHQIDVVFESSRRRGEGDFIARFLGSSVSDKRGGFEVVEGSGQAIDGEVGPVSLGKGLGGAFSEDELRVPLDVPEQRGFGSPGRDSFGGCLGVLGDSDGRLEGACGSSKKRRNNWIKTKKI